MTVKSAIANNVEPAPAKPARRLVALDSLRFVAAAAVLMQHGIEQQGPLGRSIVGWLSPGVFGVALFFLISGFVIAMSVGKCLDLRSFCIRRLLRIYPLVLVAFAVVAVLAQITDWSAFAAARRASASDWIINLLLVQDYFGVESIEGVTWTLSLELVWYGIFAIMIAKRGEAFVGPFLIAFSTVLLVAAIVSLAIHHRIPLGRPGMVYAAVLGCRVYAYHVGRLPGRLMVRDAAIFAGVMTTCNVISFGYFAHPSITVGQAVVPWLAATALFLFVTTNPAVYQSRLIQNRLLAWLGAMSFSIYLLHPIALAMAEAITRSAGMLPIALVITLLLAMAAYRLVERPAMALSRRLTPRQPMALPPATISGAR
jgi:peptidoglycan/LPS O-acetylase OafA/YrhL